jgi:hypothetical protein
MSYIKVGQPSFDHSSKKTMDFSRTDRLANDFRLEEGDAVSICWLHPPDIPWELAYYFSEDGISNMYVYWWIAKDLSWYVCLNLLLRLLDSEQVPSLVLARSYIRDAFTYMAGIYSLQSNRSQESRRHMDKYNVLDVALWSFLVDGRRITRYKISK